MFVCEREFQNINLLPCDVDMREVGLRLLLFALMAWFVMADCADGRFGLWLTTLGLMGG